MRRALAAWFNERGSQSIDSGKAPRSEMLDKLALAVDPRWSVPWYNLGLHTKNSRQWRESLRFNRRALELDPMDEGAWWNLGIAATALHDWPEAAERGVVVGSKFPMNRARFYGHLVQLVCVSIQAAPAKSSGASA